MFLKLRFFSRIRRFLRYQTGRNYKKSDVAGRSLHDVDDSPEATPEDKNYDLRRSVKKLHFGKDLDEKKEAVAVIGKLLLKGDEKIGKLLCELGVVPGLIAVLGVSSSSSKSSSRCLIITVLQALIEITSLNGGDDENYKRLMLQHGLIDKLSDLILLITSTDHDSCLPNSELYQLLLLLISSISTISNARVSIASSTILLSFVAKTVLNSSAGKEYQNGSTDHICLLILFNISSDLENAEAIVSNENDIIPLLLELTLHEEHNERALATLGNLIVTFHGKIAIENHPSVPSRFVQVISSTESKPKSQELGLYIMMILANRSSNQRDKMAEAGLLPLLLQISLLGSTLIARKRALRLMEWFKNDRSNYKSVDNFPEIGTEAMDSSPAASIREMREGRRAVRDMVKESLNKNTEMMLMRGKAAAAPGRCARSTPPPPVKQKRGGAVPNSISKSFTF